MRSLLFIVFPQSSSLGTGLGRDPVTRGRRQEAIDGGCSCAANHQKSRSRQQEEVVLITFALLRSSPVHKESKIMMNHGDGHDHVAKRSKGCNASEQSEDQTKSAEEFRGDGQKCEYGRNVQHSREESHRAGEAISTEPSEHLLSAVGEEDHSEHQSKNSRCDVVIGGNQFTKHRNSLRGNPEPGQQEIGLVSLYKDSFYRGTFCPSCTVVAKGAVCGSESLFPPSCAERQDLSDHLRQSGSLYGLLTTRCVEAKFFRSSATVFSISRESASLDTARAKDIAPTSALKVTIALDRAVRLFLAGSRPAIN